MIVLIWVIIGFVIGVLTLSIESTVIKRHIIITLLLGILGAVAGGALTHFLGLDEQKGMHFMVEVWAVIASVFVLTWYRTMEKYFSS